MTSEANDLIARLIAWLTKRGQPNSGIRFRASDPFRDNAAVVEIWGPDAEFIAKHFHGAGATELASAIASLRGHVEILQDKLDPDHTCACGFEAPEHVCLAHSPHLAAMTASAKAAEAQVVGLTRDRDEANRMVSRYYEAYLEKLREALKPFSEMAADYDSSEGDDNELAWLEHPKIGWLRRARAALSNTSEEGKDE